MNLYGRADSHADTRESLLLLSPVGEVARGLNLRALDAFEEVSRRPHELAISELGELAQEARSDGWAGPGSSAYSPRSLDAVESFLSVFPATFPSPDVSIHPDGLFSLEWYVGPRRAFSVTFLDSKRLAYSGLFDSLTVHGSETLSQPVPPSLVAHLQRLHGG